MEIVFEKRKKNIIANKIVFNYATKQLYKNSILIKNTRNISRNIFRRKEVIKYFVKEFLSETIQFHFLPRNPVDIIHIQKFLNFLICSFISDKCVKVISGREKIKEKSGTFKVGFSNCTNVKNSVQFIISQ